MEVRDWILICSATIVVAGWFVNGLLNRRHEVAKKRMEYRLEALHSFLPIFFSIQKHQNPFGDDPNLLQKLEESRSKFQLYGRTDEVALFESVVNAIEAQNPKLFLSNAEQLVQLVRHRIRSEIGLNT